MPREVSSRDMGAARRSDPVLRDSRNLGRSKIVSGRGPPGCSQTCCRASLTCFSWLPRPSSCMRRSLRVDGVSSLAGFRASARRPQYRWNILNVFNPHISAVGKASALTGAWV
jgi:hypothetical protein